MATDFRASNALSLRQLAYLVVLSETLNFTRAAQRCFVTQSTLSAGIRELERGLGVELFERDRQNVMLTAIGRELVERARLLLSQTADLVQAAHAASEPLKGTVTLGAIPTIAPFLLPRLLRLMRRELAGLTILLREEPTIELLQAVDSGEVDFAIIALPMDIGRLVAYRLFIDELWLIAADADPICRQAAPKVSQIDLQRLMLLNEGHCLREHSLLACQSGRRGRPQQPSGIEAGSLPTLIQMVEAGLGISLLPQMAVKAGLLAGTRVSARPLAAPSPKREIALVCRPTTGRAQLRDCILALATAVGTGPATAGARRNRFERARPARI